MASDSFFLAIFSLSSAGRAASASSLAFFSSSAFLFACSSACCFLNSSFLSFYSICYSFMSIILMPVKTWKHIMRRGSDWNICIIMAGFYLIMPQRPTNCGSLK
jgi:hypothetical protein